MLNFCEFGPIETKINFNDYICNVHENVASKNLRSQVLKVPIILPNEFIALYLLTFEFIICINLLKHI